jgi:hypothetical protein
MVTLPQVAPAHAGVLGHSLPLVCAKPTDASAELRDRLLRLSSIARDELEASGASVALISRSGTDLSRFGVQYSHAGLSLRANAQGPWAVRQLYYDCDAGKPRLFDQGLAGFMSGVDAPTSVRISMLLLQGPRAEQLVKAALDDALAMRLLAGTYSPTAHPFSTAYQNCNQWVVEMLAAAWGFADTTTRESAQRWLAQQGYDPEPVDVGSHLLMMVAPLAPLIRLDDHPLDDLQGLKVKTSLPDAIERFARAQVPQATRLTLCMQGQRVVVSRDAAPVERNTSQAVGCEPRSGDRVVELVD